MKNLDDFSKSELNTLIEICNEYLNNELTVADFDNELEKLFEDA